MESENRIPPALIVGLVLVVLAVGAAAYYAGRFRRSPRLTPDSAVELPPPAAPAPDAAEVIETPADIPPTVTPPIPVVIEKGRRSPVMVQKSTQIEVPVPPVVPTAVPVGGTIEPERNPAARRRIVIEVRPTLTPTVPEVELAAPPAAVVTPEPPPPEPPPEETPEPEPTARPRRGL